MVVARITILHISVGGGDIGEVRGGETDGRNRGERQREIDRGEAVERNRRWNRRVT